MFCSRKMNRKRNHIRERDLRLVYNDYMSLFGELLEKDIIHHRNVQYLAIEMYKVMNNLSPHFIQDIFEKTEAHSTRSGSTFIRPKIYTVYKGESSIRNFGPIVWNLIPENLKTCITLAKFKKQIKLWVPEKCPCRLCKTYISGLGFMQLS